MKHDREPIKHTCPDIDKYIKAIKRERVEDRELSRMSESEIFDVASSMSSILYDCIDWLEELRESNHELREWGIEEANKYDDLLIKFEELESKQVIE